LDIFDIAKFFAIYFNCRSDFPNRSLSLHCRSLRRAIGYVVFVYFEALP